MSMKRKWLRAVLLMMMAGVSFGGTALNPKEIEDLLHLMNETKVEFTIPDGGNKSDGNWPLIQSNPVQSDESDIAPATNIPGENS